MSVAAVSAAIGTVEPQQLDSEVCLKNVVEMVLRIKELYSKEKTIQVCLLLGYHWFLDYMILMK